MTQQTGAGDSRKAQAGAYKDKSKPADIRSSNINAAKGTCFKITGYSKLILQIIHTQGYKGMCSLQ